MSSIPKETNAFYSVRDPSEVCCHLFILRRLAVIIYVRRRLLFWFEIMESSSKLCAGHGVPQVTGEMEGAGRS